MDVHDEPFSKRVEQKSTKQTKGTSNTNKKLNKNNSAHHLRIDGSRNRSEQGSVLAEKRSRT
jgi:hypothetical protein